MSSFRLLGRDLVAYGILGGLSRSVNLLLLPILTRKFSPNEYGIIDILATTTSLLALFMALSLESAVARMWFESSRENKQGQLISTIISFILIFGGILFFVVWYQSDQIACLVLGNPLLANYIALGALVALLTALSGIPQIVLRMERKIYHYSVLTIIQTVSYVAFALLLIFKFKAGLDGVFVAMVLAGALTLGVGLSLIATHLSFNISISKLKSSLHFSVPLFPAVVVTWINNQADRIILLTLMGLGVVGIFGAAAKIALIIGLVVSVFQQAWTPLAISHLNNESEDYEFYRRALTYYAGSMATIALVLVAFSKELLALLVPSEYQGAYVVIPWLIGARILQGSGGITNLGMIISKRTFGNSIAAWIGAAANIALGLALIPLIGIWGSAIGSFVAGFIFTSLLCRFSMRVADVRFDLRKVFAILICYIVTSATFIATCEFINDPVLSLFTRSFLLALTIWGISYIYLDASVFQSIRSAMTNKYQ